MTCDKKKAKNYFLIAGAALNMLVLLGFEIWRDAIFGSGESSDAWYFLSTRFFGALLCLFLIFYCSYQNILKIKFRTLHKAILFTLPCWLIAINNFPIISYFSGNAYISGSKPEILFYFLQCLCVGLFEELAFRGCIFMMVLQRRRRSTKDLFWAIVISSAIFGAIHLVNIFAGASPISVILQIGYSFLIGGMCSVILMKTGCIWHCALIHAVYNFCGGVVPELGGGVIWDTPTVILTVVVSLAVAAYVIFSLLRIDVKKVGDIFIEEKEKSNGGDLNSDV
ncbi:MAG: CPBP family intramembrane metalloprotease [Clostridia bacterium]|nr:CPBP family intramembrane metalloprotease [Clostridia bacterium]